MDSIADRVKNAIHVEFRIPLADLLPEAMLQKDIGFDSLDQVELQMVMEENFHIEIDDIDFAKVETVQQLIDLVTETCEPKTASVMGLVNSSPPKPADGNGV